jgi:hypothetical protein
MKTILMASAAALLALSTGAGAQADMQTAPTSAVPTAPVTPNADAIVTTRPEVAAPAQAAPSPTSSDRWSGLDDSSRYLLIMGSLDGFSAAGPGSPCFPGSDNQSIDAKLGAAGFADRNPDGLPAELKKLSAPAEQCTGPGLRGYGNKLLKTMPDAHLATYLHGLVRSYASLKPCTTANQQYAAANVAAAIMTAPDDAQPANVVGPALVEGCKGPK